MAYQNTHFSTFKKTMTQGEIMSEYGIGRTTLWRWRKDGHFPSALQFPTGGFRFNREEVDQFFKSLQQPAD